MELLNNNNSIFSYWAPSGGIDTLLSDFSGRAPDVVGDDADVKRLVTPPAWFFNEYFLTISLVFDGDGSVAQSL
jgi:hypothetical protein